MHVWPANARRLLLLSLAGLAVVIGLFFASPEGLRFLRGSLIPGNVSVVGPLTFTAIGSDGLPIIAWSDTLTQEIKMLKCGDPDCGAGNRMTALGIPAALERFAFALDPTGKPIVAFVRTNNGFLQLVVCNDDPCTSKRLGEPITDVPARNPSLVSWKDGVAITFFNPDTRQLFLILCSDLLCATGKETILVDGDLRAPGGELSALGLKDGRPFAVYTQTSITMSRPEVKTFWCGNDECNNGNQFGTHLLEDGDRVTGLSLLGTSGASGTPTYMIDLRNKHSLLVHCLDDGCGQHSPHTSPYGKILPTNFGSGSSALGVRGTGLPPLVIFRDALNQISFMQCGNDTCDRSNVLHSLDTFLPSGAYALSMAIDSQGSPIVTYRDNETHALRVTHCLTSDCSRVVTPPWNPPNPLNLPRPPVHVIATGSTKLGKSPVPITRTSIIKGSDALPIVSYFDSTYVPQPKIVKCGNEECSSGNVSRTLDTNLDTGQGLSSVLTSGLLNNSTPTFVYFDHGIGALRATFCTNDECSESLSQTLDDGGESIVGRSLALTSTPRGNPVIAYSDETLGEVKLLICGTPTCSNSNVTRIFAPTFPTTGHRRMAVAMFPDGSPMVGDGNTVLKCGDPLCDSNNETRSLGFVHGREQNNQEQIVAIHIANATKLPVIFSVFPGPVSEVIFEPKPLTYTLVMTKCNTKICAGGTSVIFDDIAIENPWEISVALDSNDVPIIAFTSVEYPDPGRTDAEYALTLVRCGNSECSWKQTESLYQTPDADIGSFSPSVFVASDSAIMTSFADLSEGTVLMIRCEPTGTCLPTPPPPASSVSSSLHSSLSSSIVASSISSIQSSIASSVQSSSVSSSSASSEFSMASSSSDSSVASAYKAFFVPEAPLSVPAPLYEQPRGPDFLTPQPMRPQQFPLELPTQPEYGRPVREYEVTALPSKEYPIPAPESGSEPTPLPAPVPIVVPPPAPVHCGNGYLELQFDEGCDDGNTISGDGCGAVCVSEEVIPAPSVPTIEETSPESEPAGSVTEVTGQFVATLISPEQESPLFPAASAEPVYVPSPARAETGPGFLLFLISGIAAGIGIVRSRFRT